MKNNLNPNYTLDSFRVNSSNELAYFVANNIITKKEGTLYNPFFVQGKVGKGKTHLIQAIGNSIKKLNKNSKVHYTTAQEYCEELIDSLKINRNEYWQIREKYKNYDVLIVDNVDFFSGKEKLQEIFWHLINYFCEVNKPIILASNKSLFHCHLTDKLRAHCAGGIMVDV